MQVRLHIIHKDNTISARIQRGFSEHDEMILKIKKTEEIVERGENPEHTWPAMY